MFTSIRPRAFSAALLSIVMLAASGESAAQASSYPSKPIKMYVGFSPGGATDIVAAEITARSAPDGYTLLAVSSTIAVNPARRRNDP